jgi:hypothetical protein
MSKGSNTSKQELPAWQKQMYEEAYGLGKSVSQQPFIPYTGPQVAGFNQPEEWQGLLNSMTLALVYKH